MDAKKITKRLSIRGHLMRVGGDAGTPTKPINRDTTERISFDNSKFVHPPLSGNASELRCYCEVATK